MAKKSSVKAKPGKKKKSEDKVSSAAKGAPRAPKSVQDSLLALSRTINSHSQKQWAFEAAGQWYSDFNDWISTTCVPLDVLLWGGIPRGHFTDIHGDPSQGKSTLLEGCIIGNQRRGGASVVLMSEHCFDKDRMKRAGVDFNNLLPVEIESLAQGTQYIFDALQQRLEFPPEWNHAHPLLIAWDTPSNAQEEDIRLDPSNIFSQGMASKARSVRSLFRSIQPLAGRLGVTVVFLFQMHAKIGQAYVGKDTDCGGGPKYAASLRLHARQIEKIFTPTMADELIGIKSEIKIVKSKCGPPAFRSVLVPMRGMTGLDNDLAMFDFCQDLFVVDTCATCGGKVPTIDKKTGKLAWESEAFRTCDPCNRSGEIIHLFGGDAPMRKICSQGVSSNGNATAWRYICGWPQEPEICFNESQLKVTFDNRPGLRQWLADQCTRKCSKPTPMMRPIVGP